MVLHIRPLTTEAGAFTGLEVSQSFVGAQSGVTEIRLPNEWGGQTELYRALTQISVTGGVLEARSEPARYLVRHPPNALLTLRFVAQSEVGETGPAKPGNDYRVRIRPSYFLALGNAIVADVVGIDPRAPARFILTDLPKSARFASDLEHQDRTGKLSVADLKDSVLFGGEIRVLDAGGGARLAIHGAIDALTDEDWQSAYGAIAAAQRRYWGSAEEPYLVTIETTAPPEPGWVSVGGTGRNDGFAFYVTTNAPAQTIQQMIAHEMMHTWIPRKIGATPTDDVAERKSYWLSEGFTDWAMLRVMARSGFWTPEQTIDRINAFLKDYDLSPWRTRPNKETAAQFWRDRAAQDLPYRRGMLAAMYWDDVVQTKTRGRKDFDDVLLRMQTLAKERPKDLAETLLVRALHDVARHDAAPDIARMIARGEPADLRTDILAPCARLEWVRRPTFDRGFDIEATERNNLIIAGVRKDSPAYEAGLRDGMVLVRRSAGTIGDSSVEIAYDVLDAGVAKTLRWMPHGAQEETFRRLELGELSNPATRAACVRRLSGA